MKSETDREVVDLTLEESDLGSSSSCATPPPPVQEAGATLQTLAAAAAAAVVNHDASCTRKRPRASSDVVADAVVVISSESDDADEEQDMLFDARRVRPVDLVLAHTPPSLSSGLDVPSATSTMESARSNCPPCRSDEASSSTTNAFAATLASQRSPFFRGLPQSVRDRRERIAQRGLRILRLPRDMCVRDNGSIFDAFVVSHESLCKADVADCVAEIRSDEKIAMAAHPSIQACRLQPVPGSPIQETFDDDGEQYAGNKILSVLRTYRLVGCLLVVTRWYGGKLLGPRRFTHIENVARRVLEHHALIPSASMPASTGG